MFVVQSTAKANCHPNSARGYFWELAEFVFCEKKKKKKSRRHRVDVRAVSVENMLWNVWTVPTEHSDWTRGIFMSADIKRKRRGTLGVTLPHRCSNHLVVPAPRRKT